MNTIYYTRHVEEKIKTFAKYFKVVLVLGARQVGKSTLLNHVFPDLQHIVFDPVTDEFLVRSDPELFLQNFKGSLILDEIQYVPELLAVIKRYVDKSNAKGQYFLTGSHNLSMLKQVSESMAGRVGIIELSPLSLHEITNNGSRKNTWLRDYLDSAEQFATVDHNIFDNYETGLFETIWNGGMPGVLTLPDHLHADYFKAYLNTYIERDVRVVGQIDDIHSFSQFVRILSVLTAQEINYAHLGREIGIQAKTVTNWMSIMQTCYQWHEILPYYTNTIKRLSKKRKGYFSDSGFACYLQNITSSIALAAHPNRGALFETWVINQIKTLINILPFEPQIYHWRTNGGAEIDLLLEKDNVFYPIEIKCKVQLSKHDISGIMAFREAYPHLNVAKGLVIYAGENSYQINPYVTALSWKTI